jgi:hypothetical protein
LAAAKGIDGTSDEYFASSSTTRVPSQPEPKQRPGASKEETRSSPPVRKIKHEPSRGIHIVAMGDCGVRTSALQPTADLLRSAYATREATFLLGDLFYPLGIDRSLGTNDPRLPLLVETLTKSYHGPLFAIFGNHDWHGDWEAELAYAKINRRWIFPHKYYFHQIVKDSITVCNWFIDTDKKNFDTEQAAWLKSSLEKERQKCNWLVVAGHHFIFTGGEYEDNNWLIAHLLPILDKFGVHVYLAGHEHQSQVIKISGHPTWFLTAGALGDLRDKPLRGHEGIMFINKHDVAFLHLDFGHDSLAFSFVKTYNPGSGTLLYSGSITK